MRCALFTLLFYLGGVCVSASQYRYFDVKDGLSSSNITSITQDREGFLWVATEDGLNRFDGSSFVVYRNIPNDEASLVNNHVMKIYEDSKGRLWVATLTGLCLYDRTTDRFAPYNITGVDGKTESMQFYDLLEDRAGYIWVSISGNGVVRIDPEKNETLLLNTFNSGICSDHINVLYEDRYGNLWFGSGREGISVYNPGNKTFRTFSHRAEEETGLSSDEISSICEDRDGNVWVGTWAGGIDIYSVAEKSFHRFRYEPRKITYLKRDSRQNIWIGTMGSGYDIYSVAERKMIASDIPGAPVDLSSKVQTIFEDRQGNMWIGLFQKGIFMIPRNKSLFSNYTFNPFSKKPTIGDGAVQPVLMDSEGELWVGVDGKGIYRLDSLFNVTAHYGLDDPNSVLFNNVVLCMCEDSRGDVWLGTFFKGVIRYNRRTRRFDKSLTMGAAPYGLRSSQVNNIMESPDGKLWFSTNGGGINIYDPDSGTFEYIVKDESGNAPNRLIYNYCTATCVDREGIVWIGTYRGLCSYDKVRNLFTPYSLENGNMPSNIVFSLKADSRGNIWAGTQNGLVRIGADRKQSAVYNTSNGLPNSLITGIEEDLQGNIWIVTNHGLSMYNPADDTFTNYNTSDGLHTNEFKKNAITRNKNGDFIIGSMRGFTYFNPEEKPDVQAEPLNLVFNDLYVFNERIGIDDPANRVLSKTLDYSDKIVFTHRQNSFSIRFSAIEFLLPEKVNYEVMMEGFDTHWRSVKERMLTYTNLSPGDYTLTIRAWINGKDKPLVRRLSITTLPPFWATGWAKTLYAAFVMIIGYLTYRYIHERISVRRKEQLMQAKLQFFTDISHEIRTPLTLILSPLSRLISQNTNIALTQTYNLMYKNGNRLLQLVNQVMDLRALEFGKKNLCVEKTDITVFVRDLTNSFNNLAEEKNLAYTFTSEPEEITGYIDTDIVSKVLFNLISNAFKYTEDGYVCVSVTTNEKNRLVISVSDSGKGISPEQRSLIFERFYMTNTDASGRRQSSGIGLHLTNKLVILHRGEIQLAGERDRGSCFSVVIPYRKEDFSEKDFVESRPGRNGTELFAYTETDSVKISHRKTPGYRQHTILIVEDHAGIRALIAAEMADKYHVLEASDGKEGLRKAIEKRPALIISDVVMPEMDGIEFCTKVRHHDTIMHTPFIMLTARTSIEQQIEGLEHGADAYIAKPFNVNYLHATVRRLIHRGDSLPKPPVSPAEEDRPETLDEKLLKKLNDLIAKHLDDSDLGVDELSREAGLSRTHLNRKMKELTGESPASYIRQFRLRKSTQLLKEHSLTISEIAFAVGFSSPSYFSQAFRDYYGVTPKEYVRD
ncbi:MAG: response regulator [Tannerellaceae bacterium]|jgi:ligand-binding sensor domain-containing protein/signal transduction histidine kinase/DNA-binding response OmpR family regulator|nr:response regulator [Tannerellaceae bacterium]